MSEERIKRTHVYVCRPKAYEIPGCACGNDDPEWSEWQGNLWCPKCEIDFVPEHGGIFDGPIGIQVMRMLGAPVDRIVLATGMIEVDTDEGMKLMRGEEYRKFSREWAEGQYAGS